MERKTRFFVGFFFFCFTKSPGDHLIFRQNERGACNSKFHLSYNILLPRRADAWLPSPSPRLCTVSVRSYAGVITKFSRMDRLLSFLSYGAPLQPHFNAKLTTNCLHWRKPTRSTFDATTDRGVVFRSHPSCMDYQTTQIQHTYAAHSFFTAMGSPVSVVVAEIVMQNIEEKALATYTWTIPLWLRYVDDTFTAVHKDGIDDFHEHLNRQNADIQFTKEIEENGKTPFLDLLISRDNNRLRTTICRKPTRTDRLLDQSSYNPTPQKATTIRIWPDERN